mmetsp:Transcript_2948/g.12025  ORF Transcript_2948/g.12025 Transcript_2948/m.12025 type:complete len:207 (+) Transcript_2948:1168-1788(+)
MRRPIGPLTTCGQFRAGTEARLAESARVTPAAWAGTADPPPRSEGRGTAQSSASPPLALALALGRATRRLRPWQLRRRRCSRLWPRPVQRAAQRPQEPEPVPRGRWRRVGPAPPPAALQASSARAATRSSDRRGAPSGPSLSFRCLPRSGPARTRCSARQRPVSAALWSRAATAQAASSPGTALRARQCRLCRPLQARLPRSRSTP